MGAPDLTLTLVLIYQPQCLKANLTLTLALILTRLEDVHLVPITIDYEKALEASLHQSELQGNSKVAESLTALFQGASSMLRQTRFADFGSVSVHFGEPISLSTFMPASVSFGSPPKTCAEGAPADTCTEGAPTDTCAEGAPTDTPEMASEGASSSSSAAASPGAAHREGSEQHEAAVVNKPENWDMAHEDSDHARFVAAVARDLTARLRGRSRCMGTHLVASILLSQREGMSKAELSRQLQSLQREVVARGGAVEGFQGRAPSAVMDRALKLLGGLVSQPRKGIVQANIGTPESQGNAIELAYYRNHILHHFATEAILACALYAVHKRQSTGAGSARVGTVLHEALFLWQLLHRETLHKLGSAEAQLQAALQQMVQRRVLVLHEGGANEGRVAAPPPARDLVVSNAAAVSDSSMEMQSASQSVEVAAEGEARHAFLCSLVWPLIDGYYVAALSLQGLPAQKAVPRSHLLERMQSLGNKLYRDGVLSAFEGCATDVLSNAVDVLREWGVVVVQGGQVKLAQPYLDRQRLQELCGQIAALQRHTHSIHTHSRVALVAELPMLARL